MLRFQCHPPFNPAARRLWAALLLFALGLFGGRAFADHTGCGDALGAHYFGDEWGCWGNSHEEMIPRTQALMGIIEQHYPQYFPAGGATEGADEQSDAGTWIYRYYTRSYPATGYTVIAWYDTGGYGVNWYAFDHFEDGPPVDEQLDVHIYLYHPSFGGYAARIDSLIGLEHTFCADAGGLCYLYYMQ